MSRRDARELRPWPPRTAARALPWAALVAACGGAAAGSDRAAAEPPALPWEAEADPARPADGPPVLLTGGRVLTAAGEVFDPGAVAFAEGRLVAVGPADAVEAPPGAEVVDTRGAWITPGLIDAHSHMGVYAAPSVRATSDGNEATAPVTAQVRAAESFWPQDPALARALAAGVTTILVLPGSANLIGGRGATMKLHLGRSASEMAFPGAPPTLKMACGENPKRVYGGRTTAPSTRMGNVAGYRAAFQDAIEYGVAFRRWQAEHVLWAAKDDAHGRGEGEDPGPAPAPPERDFGLETLLGAIEGRVLVQVHCYRADEMALMLELAREMGFRIRAFHHAVEAYKVRDLLAADGVAVATWADWWGFKLEAFDTVLETLPLLTEAGVRGILHSDSAMLVQRLAQEAAKAATAGRRAGIEVTDDDALRWITANPAWALGVQDQTGTLEPGKMADVVVWSGTPFSVYTRPTRVYVDGRLAFEAGREDPTLERDFELGLEPAPPETAR